jgi:ubiquinone/menaquinone biosynthesis C-methylase UbiE
MRADVVPRGHRRHQLARAVELLDPAEGRLLDVGAGSGWLAEAWQGPVVALDVFGPADPPVPWVVGSTARLPFGSGAFDTVALLASLGAFATTDALTGALTEVARVLRPGGTVVALASARRPVLDAVAPHRIRTGWRWRSFPADDLLGAFRTSGLVPRVVERRAGVRSLAVDWAVTVSGPVLRRAGSHHLLERIGEADRADFARPRASGRYLYVVAERMP